jgi:hypothetical protein
MNSYLGIMNFKYFKYSKHGYQNQLDVAILH